jgi:hypothetical protein
MPWWMLLALHGPRICMDEKKEGGEGGGGSGGTPDAAALAKENAELKAKNAEFEERFKKLEGKGGGDPKDQEDLASKAAKERENQNRNQSDAKALEAALRFTMSADTFLKDNAALLPKEIADIFKAADKENFASAKHKADAIKAGVIQSFFKVQSNLDLLTPAVKSQLEDYLKLTKDGKEQEASRIFDNIFEPSFEMLRKLKKAENINRGFSGSGSSEDAYREKLMRGSRRHHLGDKSNGT